MGEALGPGIHQLIDKSLWYSLPQIYVPVQGDQGFTLPYNKAKMAAAYLKSGMGNLG